jgi:tetratricopeptide (TPR) repeat protein
MPPRPSTSPPPSLLIVHVEPALEAAGPSALYRVTQPCRALGELEHVTVVSGSLLSPELVASGLLDEADVLVIGEAAEADLLPVIDGRRRQRRLTVYELESHVLAPPAGARTAERARDLVRRSMPPQLARQADGLQLATPALATRFGFLNARRAVFPSQLWDAPAPAARRARAAGRVVIGWAGSPVQLADLRDAAPALRGVLERHPEVDLRIMGLGPAALAEALGEVPDGRVTLAPAGSREDYTRFLDGLDIGLAPLLPTEFNRCRADTRFLEYAAHGVLAVCADLESFREAVLAGQTGFLHRDAAELETVLERVLAEPELRASAVQRAAKYVSDERLERSRVGDRLAFYLSVATQLGLPLAPRAVPDPLERLGVEPAFAGSRYVALGGGPTETLLREGLAARRAGALADARRCFDEARRLSPRAYMPELLLGETEEDPTLSVEALERAAELNPRSCLAPFLIGLRHGYAGAAGEASAALQRARAIAPSFGAPQERLGQLAASAGRVEEASALYEEAALQNGAYALPVARLAELATRTGRVDKAVALLERSLGADPDLWLTNLVLGRAYLEQRRFHQARVHLQRALDGAEDRAAVLHELARAEVGLGELAAAQALLDQARQVD